MIERDEVFRIRTERSPGILAGVLSAIAGHGAQIGEIETLYMGHDHNIREVTVIAPGDEAVEAIHQAIDALPGVQVVADHIDKVRATHEGGKLVVRSRVEVRTLQDMREVYTPGVARMSQAIADDPSLAGRYTWKGRTLAVVSDGSRVLGLGDIGPLASLPVMEGKALFYAELVDLNAVPIVLATSDPDEIIETVVRISPGFGGIHLEDIASPGVYRVEEELEERLDIPVMHDDQHGTAVVVLGAVLAAEELLDRPLAELSFGQVGLGAAGSAIARLALEFPFTAVHAFDPTADAATRLAGLAPAGAPLHVGSEPADFERVLAESDVLVLTTGRAGLLEPGQVRAGQAIFALSNPVPEIGIAAALAAGAAIATDGSIVNNVLAFPGLFRGALDAGAPSITTAMKRAAAEALADLSPEGVLLPDPLDRSVHRAVAQRVAEAFLPPRAGEEAPERSEGDGDADVRGP